MKKDFIRTTFIGGFPMIKDTLVLSHYYTIPEVQQMADFVGDSLELAMKAKEVNPKRIVFAGVKFMAETAKHFYQAIGKKTGIKPAGGISTPEDASLYMHIIREILGREWITQEHFRIGASRLANH